MDDNVFHNSVLAVPIGESIGRQPFEGWISVLETFGGHNGPVCSPWRTEVRAAVIQKLANGQASL